MGVLWGKMGILWDAADTPILQTPHEHQPGNLLPALLTGDPGILATCTPAGSSTAPRSPGEDGGPRSHLHPPFPPTVPSLPSLPPCPDLFRG